MLEDTITAIATAPGQGGIGVIRISGAKTKAIATRLLGKIPEPRCAHFAHFLNGENERVDHGIALFFPKPNSFTGEDVLELQGHGSPITLDRMIQAILASGARLAQPGEFSKRAFLNNKIDLAQAEAIADLIACQSEEAAKAAMRSLQGDFSAAVNHLVEKLTVLRMYVEAAIDFPEEEVDFLNDGIILTHLEELLASIEQLQQKSKQGSILREGITVVITGLPNAGKSSLLNALSGEESAIVTDIPGTTRDILKEKIICDGLPIHILDTAGLRESVDIIEQEGIRRAKQALKTAQVILLVVDVSQATKSDVEAQIAMITEWVGAHIPLCVALNKCDLLHESDDQMIALTSHPEMIALMISAKTHVGFDSLKNYFKSIAGMTQSLEGCFLARRRHLEAIAAAYSSMILAREQLVEFKAGELLAEELRQAQLFLSEITGQFSSDDLLGQIFGSFCIGK
jgi:tRNA modification GTPase